MQPLFELWQLAALWRSPQGGASVEEQDPLAGPACTAGRLCRVLPFM